MGVDIFGKLIFWELTFWELTFWELTFWESTFWEEPLKTLLAMCPGKSAAPIDTKLRGIKATCIVNAVVTNL